MRSSQLKKTLANKRVLITAGPTREYVDTVRFFSNASSGKMALSLSDAFQRRGAKVFVVCGPGVKPGSNYSVRRVTTAVEMLREARQRFDHCDIFVSAAAVCDYRPERTLRRKLPKKSRILSLRLVRNPDILAEMSRMKKKQFCLGFALEDSNPLKNALAKMRDKQCDLMVLNSPGAMESDYTEPALIFPSGKVERLGRVTKKSCAESICRAIEEILCGKKSRKA